MAVLSVTVLADGQLNRINQNRLNKEERRLLRFTRSIDEDLSTAYELGALRAWETQTGQDQTRRRNELSKKVK